MFPLNLQSAFLKRLNFYCLHHYLCLRRQLFLTRGTSDFASCLRPALSWTKRLLLSQINHYLIHYCCFHCLVLAPQWWQLSFLDAWIYWFADLSWHRSFLSCRMSLAHWLHSCQFLKFLGCSSFSCYRCLSSHRWNGRMPPNRIHFKWCRYVSLSPSMSVTSLYSC